MTFYKKAFTLAETLIVVVLVGIVVAVAVPAVNQYRATVAQAIMQDDGARLGAAAQTYFAESFTRSLTLKYDAETGKIEGPEGFSISNGNRIAAGYKIDKEMTIELNKNDAIQLVHEYGGTYIFNDKGTLTKTKE